MNAVIHFILTFIINYVSNVRSLFSICKLLKEKDFNTNMFTTMKKTAAERVRELRKALKLSLEKFSNETDLSFSLLSKAETGVVPVTDDMIEKISKRWKCPVAWLSKGDGELSFEKSMKSDLSDNPYKDYAIQRLERELEKEEREKQTWQQKYDQLWDMFSKVTSGEINFLTLVKESA